MTPMITHSPVATSPDRRSLIDVLVCLEKRGASQAVIRLAMERAGMAPDVAALLSRCVPSWEAAIRAAPLPVPVVRPVNRFRLPQRSNNVASAALRYIARTFIWWGVLLAGGLGLGFAVGFDLGVGEGLEQGLDQFQRLVWRVFS
jgi:hypothetical protein